MRVSIRESYDSDLEDILTIEREAFGKEDEALLVRDLLNDESAKPYVSLLAFEGEKAVGHVLFTKARLEPEVNLSVSLLAPLAIIPESQKKGIGGKLIQHGLEILSKQNTRLVFVLGHPEYYARYGFQPAGRLGFEATYRILEKNADAWMVQELQPSMIEKHQGRVICADALNKPEYWRE